MTDRLIAVLGGYGEVGATAVRRLSEHGCTRIRVGGRNPSRGGTLHDDLPGIELSYVDIDETESLEEFCTGAHLVLNCAGPSYRILDTVAKAASAAGAHYVDVAGDVPAFRALGSTFGDRVAVFSAGLMPGLTGLLPRLIAGPGDRLDIHVGGAVGMTPASAADILLAQGPDFGESLALWRGGAVVPRSLAPLRSVQPAGFPEPVDAMPFLPTESTRMAADLSLDELRFYTAYASEAIPTTLAMAWADDPEFRDDYIELLTQAAKSDLRERDPYYVLTALVPTATGAPPSLTLRTCDPYQLSGVVAALTAEAVLQEKISPGVHFADSALEPADIAEALQRDPLVQSLSIQGPPRRTIGEHRR
ncbi:saccharopine dehydrogenase NADP-binding domain-containing protein [Saccharopolyspora sp. WRP15-2]|uniref:Saccharopine dehydrogenase NADP-binding domain-containing protein n=1 Tax=Saccharopolyspora oryzae TaxID=2997343 RepID=A0ABT4VC28_9PSEU|nr:saccharopine dehydrogenase NADP-binding domain-containing protein [Saccharopolyspora oryzae]MDA3630842.1 saccharopine dehydrogenase NADP-binding domain-containing protein [Saccharopolyspora oryzae]